MTVRGQRAGQIEPGTILEAMTDAGDGVGHLILGENGIILAANAPARQFLGIDGSPTDLAIERAIGDGLGERLRESIDIGKRRFEVEHHGVVLTFSIEPGNNCTHVRIQPHQTSIAPAQRHAGANPLHELREIAIAASSASTADTLLERVLRGLRRLMPVDAFITSIILPGDDFASTIFRVEGDTRYPPRRPASPDIQRGLRLSSAVIMDFMTDEGIARFERFGDPNKTVRSVLAAPLRSEGRTVGQIAAQSYDLNAYTPADADLLTAVGQCVSNALYRTTILEDLERQASRESLLRDVAEQLHVAADLPSFLSRVTDAIFGQIGTVITSISTLDRETGKLVRQAVRSVEGTKHPPIPGTVIPQGGAATRAVESASQVYVEDVSADQHEETRTWSHSGVGSIVATPITDGSRCYGVIITSRAVPRAFDEHDLGTLQSVAELVKEGLQAATLLEESEQYVRDLVEVQSVTSLASASLDMARSVERIVVAVTNLFDADSSVVRILEDGQLVRFAGTGNDAKLTPLSLPLEATLSGKVVTSGEIVVVNDVTIDVPDYQPPYPSARLTRAFLGVPLRDDSEQAYGLIAVKREAPYQWTERDIRLLDTIAMNVSVAIRNAREFERTRNTLRASIESLAAAVDAKDPATLHHSQHVAGYATAIARQMGLERERIDQIELAGLLHDVGKIGVPDDILVKPGSLDPAEWAAMQLHPVIGAKILTGNPLLEPLLPMIRHHHERWDGFGYPDRLRGDQIPLGAAIIALADAFDTMTTKRTYRDPLPLEEAISEIRQGRGTQFNPGVVDAFFVALDDMSLQVRPDFPTPQQTVTPMSGSTMDRATDARALMIFHGTAREIAAVDDLDELLQNIAGLIRETMGDFLVYVSVIDPDTGRVRAQAIAGRDEPQDDSDQPVELSDEGVIAWVLENRRPANIADVRRDLRYRALDSRVPVRSELAVPLIAEGEVVGVINLESERPAAFSRQDEQLLVTTADYLAQAIHTALLLDIVRQQATTDALTGLANHHTFYIELQRLVSEAESSGRHLSLVILDVNNLKEINDTYGHLAGDRALRGLADALKDHARRTDIVCRYGGDEFAVIMPDTNRRAARAAAAKFERRLKEMSVDLRQASISLPTFSWGVAEFPSDASRPAELVTIADQNMYADKRTRPEASRSA